MSDQNTVANAHPSAADCESPLVKQGGVTVASNLPHGMTIIHAGKRLMLNGANHKSALYMGGTESGKFGLTHNVDAEWIENWIEVQRHPAAVKGHIRVNKPNLITGQIAEQKDEVKTGADRLIPDEGKKDGVEKRTDKD